MKLHTCITSAPGVEAVTPPPGAGRIIPIYQQHIPHFPHKWKCQPAQITAIRAKGIRVDDDGTVYQNGGLWTAAQLLPFQTAIDAYIASVVPADFDGAIMANIESLPINDPAAKPWLDILFRACGKRPTGFYDGLRWDHAVNRFRVVTTGGPTCQFVSLYALHKLIVEGRPWHPGEAQFDHWFSDHLPKVVASKDGPARRIALLNFDSEFYGQVPSDMLRSITAHAIGWGFQELAVWGYVRDNAQAKRYTQTLASLSDWLDGFTAKG